MKTISLYFYNNIKNNKITQMITNGDIAYFYDPPLHYLYEYVYVRDSRNM